MSEASPLPVSVPEQSQTPAEAESSAGTSAVDAYNGLSVFGDLDEGYAWGDGADVGSQDFAADADESEWEDALASWMDDHASEDGSEASVNSCDLDMDVGDIGADEGDVDLDEHGAGEKTGDVKAAASERYPSVFERYRQTLERFYRGEATAKEVSAARQDMLAAVLAPTLPQGNYLPRGPARGATQEGGRHPWDKSSYENWQREMKSRREAFDAALEMNRQAIARAQSIDAQLGLPPYG